MFTSKRRLTSSLKLSLYIAINVATFQPICSSLSCQRDANNSTLYSNEGPLQPEVCARPVMGIKQLRVGKDIFTEDQFKAIQTILYDREKVYDGITVSQFGHMGVVTKAIATPYNDYQMHRYDDYRELKQSGGPLANQELCLEQLNYIAEISERIRSQGYKSKFSPFHDLLDTFGRVPAGMYEGNLLWLGLYDKCLRLKMSYPEELALPAGSMATREAYAKTRYCLASIRATDWPQERPWADFVSMKAGICLPKACDSIPYKDKYSLVQRLLEFNARDVDRAGWNVVSLYCLPDEASVLRSWWRSPETALSMAALSIWLSMLIYSTHAYSSHSKRSEPANGFSMSRGFNLDETTGVQIGSMKREGRMMSIYRCLSLTCNFRNLFDTSKESSLLVLNRDNKRLNSQADETRKVVNLNVLNGIKVVLMVYVILGHILMAIFQVADNPVELVKEFKVVFYVANMAPAFAVSGFFTITGILTSYLLLRVNVSQRLIGSPSKWLALIAYRYTRIMPTYLLVVLYAKHLSKFAGSGPLWDYSTSTLAHRKRCEAESWTWSILFLANFKSPVNHCVVSAWYLANDFQFFLLTPLFMLILLKSPKFGDSFLKFTILLTYLASFLKIFRTDFHDFRPIASFQAHGAQTHLNVLHSYYTQPQYRISGYLLGLLVGHKLFRYEQAKLAAGEPSRGYSEWFHRRGGFASFALVAFCVLGPIVATLIQFNQLLARVCVAAIQPLFYLSFSLGAGLYILLAATGNGNHTLNRFLSSRLWKPLARLSLCAVLINMEVVTYILQSMRQTQTITSFSYLTINAYCIAATYLLSIGLNLFFEAPMRFLLNNQILLAAMRARKFLSSGQ